MTLRESLQRWFPWPFVGVVVLLAVLIILTPNLLSTGSPAAGTFPTQAEIVVDRGPVSPNVTHLYVKSVGNVRYDIIAVRVSQSVDWANASVVWGNASTVYDSLVFTTSTTTNPIALNVSVTYRDPSGGVAIYVGVYAFQFVGQQLNTLPLLPSEATVPPTALTNLPLYLLLSVSAPGTP